MKTSKDILQGAAVANARDNENIDFSFINNCVSDLCQIFKLIEELISIRILSLV